MKKTKTTKKDAPAVVERIFAEPYETIAATLREHPDVWYLVGSGPRERLGVFAQTAYRIRRNKIKAFASGSWETRVSSLEDPARRPEEAVEVYLKFNG